MGGKVKCHVSLITLSDTYNEIQLSRHYFFQSGSTTYINVQIKQEKYVTMK